MKRGINILNAIVFSLFFFSYCSPKTENKSKQLHESGIKLNAELIGSKYSKISDSLAHLKSILKKILVDDQKYRDIRNISLLRDSTVFQKELDSRNRVLVDSLLSKHGFLGIKQVGYFGFLPIILTLIHADTNYKKKYIKIINNQFKNGNVSRDYYAMFIDKYLYQTKKLQKYGTQFYIYPNGKMVYYPFNPALI